MVTGLMLGAASTLAQTLLPNLPLPKSVIREDGSLVIDRGLQISFDGFTEPRLDRARDRFLMQLSRETGILYWPDSSPSQPRLIIQTDHTSQSVQQLGEDESYHLQVSPDKIVLHAPNPLGILHGFQTLLQLVQVSDRGFVIPAGTFEDKPRFPWRGLMIDTGRHFIPVDILRQNLDLMEATKLNVFHWHLSEDQGFSIESRTYPLLQGKGSDGLYYTQDQVRSLLDYAHDRGIRVVPEFDMPGHAGAWFAGYPQLASGTGPYSIARKWGIFDPAMDPSRESTYQFLDRFFGEMTALFPDAYFHIGGDECNGKEWDANPRIQSFMQAHQLKDNAALQAFFTGRVQKLVTKYHKITVGWDEVLQPDTPRDVVIQSWRGQDSLAAAAQQGNRGILSWGYYLDLNEPASQHYAVDPMGGNAARLSPDRQNLILGGEAAMWTEYITPEILSMKIWPRAAVVAERLWSPQTVTDPVSMYRRLAIFTQRAPFYGLAVAPMNQALVQRILGDQDPSSLLRLASVVEPPKEYVRESLRDYDTYTPLNRLSDIAPPESDEAREFNSLANRIAAGDGSPSNLSRAAEWLTLWRDNDAALQPLLAHSALSLELAPMSLNLKETAAIGLAAISAIEAQKPPTDSVALEQLAVLKKEEAPQAVLFDAIVPGVEALVRASLHPHTAAGILVN